MNDGIERRSFIQGVGLAAGAAAAATLAEGPRFGAEPISDRSQAHDL